MGECSRDNPNACEPFAREPQGYLAVLDPSRIRQPLRAMPTEPVFKARDRSIELVTHRGYRSVQRRLRPRGLAVRVGAAIQPEPPRQQARTPPLNRYTMRKEVRRTKVNRPHLLSRAHSAADGLTSALGSIATWRTGDSIAHRCGRGATVAGVGHRA